MWGIFHHGRIYCCYKRKACLIAGNFLDDEQRALNALRAKREKTSDPTKIKEIDAKIDKIINDNKEAAREARMG